MKHEDIKTIDNWQEWRDQECKRQRVQEAVEKLSQELHWALEKYDPSEVLIWEELDEGGKEVCRAVIEYLLCSKKLILDALGIQNG